MASDLTKEQKAFLEECESEFSDRFTDADSEYKEVYDKGIPAPPIMFPWYGRARFNRERPGSSNNRYNDRRGPYENNQYQDRNYRRNFSDNGNRNSYNQQPRRFNPF